MSRDNDQAVEDILRTRGLRCTYSLLQNTKLLIGKMRFIQRIQLSRPISKANLTQTGFSESYSLVFSSRHEETHTL